MLLVILGLMACSKGVPNISDPHNIEVDGQKLTQKEFLEKYCTKEQGNATCIQVSNAMGLDAAKGGTPKRF